MNRLDEINNVNDLDVDLYPFGGSQLPHTQLSNYPLETHIAIYDALCERAKEKQ